MKDKKLPCIIKGEKIAKTLTENQVREILVKQLQAYIDRNSDLPSFLNDIAHMGGTLGNFFGWYDSGSKSHNYIDVRLEDDRVFSFKKKDIYSEKRLVQEVLL